MANVPTTTPTKPAFPTFVEGDEQGARNAAEAKLANEGRLDPPGAGRDAALAQEAEHLIQRAQEIMGQMTVNPASDALEIEREVRQAMNDINEVYVSNVQPGYTYAWIYRDPHNEYGGRYVRRMQAIGWEVVSADNLEAKEHRFADGTRVVADCLLMRLKLERRAALDKRDRALRDAQQDGIVSRVHDLAERAGTRVYDKLPGFVEEAISSQADQRRGRALREYRNMNKNGRVDQMLKTGTIPGVSRPGAGR